MISIILSLSVYLSLRLSVVSWIQSETEHSHGIQNLSITYLTIVLVTLYCFLYVYSLIELAYIVWSKLHWFPNHSKKNLLNYYYCSVRLSVYIWWCVFVCVDRCVFFVCSYRWVFSLFVPTLRAIHIRQLKKHISKYEW